MIYLNTVEEGGETVLTKIGQAFKPKTGTAAIWNGLIADGTPYGNTLHQANQVKKGHKTVITKWFRRNPNTNLLVNMDIKEANEYIHHYTREGIFKQQFPVHFFKQINDIFQSQGSMQKQ